MNNYEVDVELKGHGFECTVNVVADSFEDAEAVAILRVSNDLHVIRIKKEDS